MMTSLLGIKMTNAEQGELAYLMSKDARLMKIYNSLSENERRAVLKVTLSEMRELKKIAKVV